MNEIVQYSSVIVAEGNLRECHAKLRSHVEDGLKAGWLIQGGISISTTLDEKGNVQFYLAQAMVRSEENKMLDKLAK